MTKKLFIHIPKNAGLTVRRSLSGRIITCNGNGTFITEDYKNRLTKTMAEAGEHHGYEHARWRDVNKNLTNKYPAFAIIRNPWTKVVSRYQFGRRLVMRGNIPEEYIGASFEEFIDKRFQDEFYWHRAVKGWFPQKDHVTDAQGNIKCDIIRFEHFADDLKKYFNLPPKYVFNSANHAYRGSSDPKLKRWDIDYRTLYTDNTIQIIADWYKDDIEMFGFDFDSAATKHVWNQS